MTAAIEFSSVSKQYRRRRARSVREWFGAWAPWVRQQQPEGPDRFWALREVSFSIERGESVGFIGHNGAGKSTSLKLVGRLITPSRGRVTVRGRVTALLELGAGFHPELTGRDNVYLSGALIGMSRAEVRAKFDEIVAFSEIEEFIDMPVKHYSSGMYARLAFSVSAHVDPEVLLVDEALAVGDYNFQQKCLARLDDLKTKGVTIVLVSHAHDAILQHCRRAIWFDHGRVLADGSAESVVHQYLDRVQGQDLQRLAAESDAVRAAQRWGSHEIELIGVRLSGRDGRERAVFETFEPMTITIDYRVNKDLPGPVIGLAISRQDGVHVTGPNTSFDDFDLPPLRGTGSVHYTIPSLPMLDGTFLVSASVHNRQDTVMYDYHDRLYAFKIINRTGLSRQRYGLISLAGTWSHDSQT